MRIWKKFKFDASHQLTKQDSCHPCSRMHGHTWSVTVFLEGGLDEYGWVMDFGEVKKAMAPVLDKLDHRHLNDLRFEGMRPPLTENTEPTCENIAIWIWSKLKPDMPMLTEIQVTESDSSGCSYAGLP